MVFCSLKQHLQTRLEGGIDIKTLKLEECYQRTDSATSRLCILDRVTGEVSLKQLTDIKCTGRKQKLKHNFPNWCYIQCLSNLTGCHLIHLTTSEVGERTSV
uniref:Uncharacterized protein n=1 Tax=Arion vulgaris TaxID=1028688 RepID=A0A0B7B5P5_9EUPU